MAAFLNLLGKSRPPKLTSFYWRAPNAAGGFFCGARMTCPTHLHEWCLSVVPGWPAERICMSGVYLWCQDDLPNTFAWVVSIYGARMTCPTHLHEWCLSMVPGWPAQHICMSGVYLWCQDDLPNTFAWVVFIHPYIHPVNGNGNHFLLVCQTTFNSTLIGLRAFDLVSSPVWWEAATNTDHFQVNLNRPSCFWPAQHICMSGVYSPIYSSSKWQWESFSTCVSDHFQVNLNRPFKSTNIHHTPRRLICQ